MSMSRVANKVELGVIMMDGCVEMDVFHLNLNKMFIPSANVRTRRRIAMPTDFLSREHMEGLVECARMISLKILKIIDSGVPMLSQVHLRLGVIN